MCARNARRGFWLNPWTVLKSVSRALNEGSCGSGDVLPTRPVQDAPPSVRCFEESTSGVRWLVKQRIPRARHGHSSNPGCARSKLTCARTAGDDRPYVMPVVEQEKVWQDRCRSCRRVRTKNDFSCTGCEDERARRVHSPPADADAAGLPLWSAYDTSPRVSSEPGLGLISRRGKSRTAETVGSSVRTRWVVTRNSC